MRALTFLLFTAGMTVSVIVVEAMTPKELFYLQRSVIRRENRDSDTTINARTLNSALGTLNENTEFPDVFFKILHALKEGHLFVADAHGFVKLMVCLAKDSIVCNTFWAYLTIFDIILGVYGNHERKYKQSANYVESLVLYDLNKSLSSYADLVKYNSLDDTTVHQYLEGLKEIFRDISSQLTKLITNEPYYKMTSRKIATKIVSILDESVPKEVCKLFPKPYDVIGPAYRFVIAELAKEK